MSEVIQFWCHKIYFYNTTKLLTQPEKLFSTKTKLADKSPTRLLTGKFQSFINIHIFCVFVCQ